MKINTWCLSLGMAGTALFLVYLLGQVKALKVEARSLKASLAMATPNRPAPATVVNPPPQSPTEIADYMTKLQRHANKLYFAGKLENWPLADFYVEEIEETVNEIIRKELTDGPVNVSGLIPALMNPEILELERAVAQKNYPEFEKHYQMLVSNCNACHTATKRPYLVIDLPRTPVFDNQHYEPVPVAAPAQTSVRQDLKSNANAVPVAGAEAPSRN